MLYRPLFLTSFLIDDMLADSDLFGGDTVVLASASSKTAFGVAHLLARREGVRVIGLTSESNAEFVRSLGCYDDVVTYDDARALPHGRAVFVDMSGDASVVRSVHERYGDNLVHSMIVGLTHWEDRSAPGDAGPLPGPAPAMFFAPSQIEKRREDWGPGAVEAKLTEAWTPFLDWVDGAVRIQHHDGPDEVASVFADLVDGVTSPDVAHVLHP